MVDIDDCQLERQRHGDSMVLEIDNRGYNHWGTTDMVRNQKKVIDFSIWGISRTVGDSLFPSNAILMFHVHCSHVAIADMQWFGLNHRWRWTRRTWSYRVAIIYFFWTLFSHRYPPISRCARFCLYPKWILKSSPEWLASSSKFSTSLALSSTGPSTWDSFPSSYKCQSWRFRRQYVSVIDINPSVWQY